MESILHSVSIEPMELTYLGIGSSPHLQPGQTLDPKNDQLIPQCFHEFLVQDKTPMRILHFDPHFATCVEFLHVYFEKWNLLPMDCSYGMTWMGEHMEVIIVPEKIDHEDHFWFVQQLCDTVLQQKGKLVLQEYTGYEVKSLNQRLYEVAEDKELYKRRILLDMTYGTDIGCSTDMTKAQPFYDYDLNFLNLHFMTEQDTKRWIHISLKLDEILKQKYTANYVHSLNNLHVDYRRKLKGDTLLFGHPLYTEASTPDEIMLVLQEALKPPFEILQGLQVVDKEAREKFQSLFLSYKGSDPYKWHDAMRKLIPTSK